MYVEAGICRQLMGRHLPGFGGLILRVGDVWREERVRCGFVRFCVMRVLELWK